jgi:hypothetical protein
LRVLGRRHDGGREREGDLLVCEGLVMRQHAHQVVRLVRVENLARLDCAHRDASPQRAHDSRSRSAKSTHALRRVCCAGAGPHALAHRCAASAAREGVCNRARTPRRRVRAGRLPVEPAKIARREHDGDLALLNRAAHAHGAQSAHGMTYTRRVVRATMRTLSTAAREACARVCGRPHADASGGLR